MSVGGYFRASVRRAMALPPVWVGRPRLPVETVEISGSPIDYAAIFAREHWGDDWPDGPLPDYIENCTGALLSPVGASVHAPAETVIRGGGDCFAGEIRTVRDGLGCEGLAPEGTSGARRMGDAPANANQSHISSVAPLGRKRGASLGPVDLRAAPSAMDARAAASMAQAAPARVVRALVPGKVVCGRCSGPEGVPVPADFGRDCIERPCPLKVS